VVCPPFGYWEWGALPVSVFPQWGRDAVLLSCLPLTALDVLPVSVCPQSDYWDVLPVPVFP